MHPGFNTEGFHTEGGGAGFIPHSPSKEFEKSVQ